MLSLPLIFEMQQVGDLPTSSLVAVVSPLARNEPRAISSLVMPPNAWTEKPIPAETTHA